MSLDFIGGIFQANSQDKATKQNAKNVQDSNRMNLLLSLMSRGTALSESEANSLGVPELAGKSSAVLPYYLADIEKATGTAAGKMALAIQKAAPTIGDYTKIVAPYLAQAGQARDIAGNLLSGQMTQQMLSEEAPVAAARSEVAQTQKNTALESLDKTLNEIDAIQARKGYSGDSYGNRLLKATTRAGVMSASSGAIAQANLANELEKQAVKEKGRNLQLSNLGLPSVLASSALALKRAPTATASSSFADSMQPLSFFNIGNHPFQQQNLPLVDSTSKAGLAISGVAAGGNSALNAGLQKYFQSLDNSSDGSGYTRSTPSPGAGEGGAGFDYGTGAAAGGGYVGDVNVPPPVYG
jgi:hypothetical protein